MWKTNKQVRRLLDENNQNNLVRQLLDDVWDMEDNVKRLEERIRALETQKGE